MKNNYINVRIKPYHHHKEMNDIKHNQNTATKRSNRIKSFKNYEDTFINYQDEKPLKKLRTWREEHNQKYKARRKENLTNSNSTILNGIISFSPALKEDLGIKYSKQDWEDANRKAVEKIAEELDTEIMYISFHYKELTPHMHFHLKNFDSEGRSVFYKHRHTEALSRLQDIAFEELKSLGLARGRSKAQTGKTHQTTKVYYSKLYKSAQDSLRELNKDLKAKRKELSDQDIEIEEKKLQGSVLSDNQKVIRNLDKLLSKSKKGEVLTLEEIEEMKKSLPFISELIPQEERKAVIEVVANATKRNQNHNNTPD